MGLVRSPKLRAILMGLNSKFHVLGLLIIALDISPAITNHAPMASVKIETKDQKPMNCAPPVSVDRQPINCGRQLVGSSSGQPNKTIRLIGTILTASRIYPSTSSVFNMLE